MGGPVFVYNHSFISFIFGLSNSKYCLTYSASETNKIYQVQDKFEYSGKIMILSAINFALSVTKIRTTFFFLVSGGYPTIISKEYRNTPEIVVNKKYPCFSLFSLDMNMSLHSLLTGNTYHLLFFSTNKRPL